MTSTVRESLAKASKVSDRLAALLCLAGSAETAAELSGRLVRMSDDARVLAGALERMAERDGDQKEREKARREQERYKKKTQRDKVTAEEIASEATQQAVEQAMPTQVFINWAAVPIVEDEPEEIQVESGVVAEPPQCQSPENRLQQAVATNRLQPAPPQLSLHNQSPLPR